MVFSCWYIEEKFFNETMSSLAGLKKIIQFLAKVPILAIFGYLGPRSKSILSTYKQNFEKSLVNFLGEVVKNLVLNFELSIFAGLWGGSPFASRHFPKSVILASCNFMGRAFVACYACSIVFFVLPDNKLLIASNEMDFYCIFGY